MTIQPDEAASPATAENDPAGRVDGRGHVRLVAMTVAALMLVIAIVFAIGGVLDRSDAADDRRRAEQHLDAQQKATRDAATELTARQDRYQVPAVAAAAVLAELVKLGNVARARRWDDQSLQTQGAADTPPFVDEYNATRSRMAADAAQFDELLQQLLGIPASGGSQVA
jgi:hypothetical protein